MTGSALMQHNVLHLKQREHTIMKNASVKSVTTSIRIKPHLREALESLSAHSGHGMNWLIEQALEEYLQQRRHELLLDQACKDILFLQDKEQDDSFWESAYDDSGWV